MVEKTALQLQEEYEFAMAELQRHTEYLFRKAGECPEAKRLRLAVLNYRLSCLKDAEEDAERPS